MTQTTSPTLCIVESLGFLEETTHREGEIISRTLRLSGKKADYVYIRSRSEFEAFADEFGRSTHRYLHIACHGNTDSFFTTTDEIDAKEFACILAPHVINRRVFLSACSAATSSFAKILLNKQPKCSSVVAPVGEIRFDDAAIFWTSFYHLTFKKNRNSMNGQTMMTTIGQCAKLVDQQFIFFYKSKGRLFQKKLG